MIRGFRLITACFLFISGCADDRGGAKNNENTTDTHPFIGGCKNLITATDDEGSPLVIVTAHAAQNYSFKSILSAETIPVRAASNLHFDWNDVTRDMPGRNFDPLSSVDMMEVLLWEYRKEDLLRDINDDNLNMERFEAAGYIRTENALSAGEYLDVLSPGDERPAEEKLLAFVDTTVYLPDEYVYLFMVAEGTTIGKGTKMLLFFQPGPEETNTEIHLTNSSTVLDFSVDLTTLTPVEISSGTPNIVFD